MGLFDSLFKSNTSFKYYPKSEQEAWVAVCLACMAVDGSVSQPEIDRMVSSLLFKIGFDAQNTVQHYKTAFTAHQQIGSKMLIDQSAFLVSEGNCPVLFALIMDLLLADGILGEKEKEIIEYLSPALHLESDISQKIVEVMLIKNAGNKQF